MVDVLAADDMADDDNEDGGADGGGGVGCLVFFKEKNDVTSIKI